MRIIAGVFVSAMLCLVLPAYACGPEVRVQFFEESPDRFRISFERGPKLRLISLRIELGTSVGGAFFDGTDGLDIQSAQPNPAGVSIVSVAYQGGEGTGVTVGFDGFVEGRATDFASDLDDRGRGADPDQNHLFEGELARATARATLVGEDGRRIEIDGEFDAKHHARLGDRACV